MQKKEDSLRVFSSAHVTGRTYPRRKGQKRLDKTAKQQAAARLRKGEAW